MTYWSVVFRSHINAGLKLTVMTCKWLMTAAIGDKQCCQCNPWLFLLCPWMYIIWFWPDLNTDKSSWVFSYIDKQVTCTTQIYWSKLYFETITWDFTDSRHYSVFLQWLKLELSFEYLNEAAILKCDFKFLILQGYAIKGISITD